MRHSVPFIPLLALLVVTAGVLAMPRTTPGWRKTEIHLHHPIYEWLDRMSVLVPEIDLFLDNKPYRWEDVERALRTIRENYLDGELSIQRYDRARLARFEAEYLRFHSPLEGKSYHHRERHLLSLTGEDFTIFGEGEIAQLVEAEGSADSASNSADRHLSRTTLGLILRGSLLERVQFSANSSIARIQGSEIVHSHFNASEGLPFNAAGNTGGFQDWTEGSFYIPFPPVEIALGKSNPVWGPGYRGQATLSATSPSFNNIRLKGAFGSLMFTAIHGWLRGEVEPRYLAGHRLEWRFRPGCQVALSETVVYGMRDIELEYLVPINIYHFSEHFLGDKDNNTISADFSAVIARRIKLYGEFFIDDFNTSKNLATWWGNKWACVGGFTLAHNLGGTACDLRVESGRVEPYVYTHREPRNVYNHFDSNLGLWSGPNSEYLFGELRLYPFSHLSFRGSCERLRKGEGDIFTHHEAAEGDEKHFLSGIVEKTTHLSLAAFWEPRSKMFLKGDIYRKDIDNFELEDGIGRDFYGASLSFSYEY